MIKYATKEVSLFIQLFAAGIDPLGLPSLTAGSDNYFYTLSIVLSQFP